MKKLITGTVVILALLSQASYAMDGREIMAKALNATYYQGNDQRAQAHMRIIDAQGRERIRQMTVLRINSAIHVGIQKYFVYFTKPNDVKKMTFMAWKNVSKDDDRWLYLPALDLVKRIAASDERSSFVGSNFFYEDISGRGLDEDKHILEAEEGNAFVLRSVPKALEQVEFSFYRMWINNKTFLPMKIEYFDAKNVNYRTYQALDVIDVDGYPTVTKAQVDDHNSGAKTIVVYSDIKYSQGIPEKIFSERYLRRAPKKYLR